MARTRQPGPDGRFIPGMESKAAREEREVQQFHLQTDVLRLNEALEAVERDRGRPISDHWRAGAIRLLDAGRSVEAIIAGLTEKDSAGDSEPALPLDADSDLAVHESDIPVQDWRAIIKDRIETEDYSFNALGNEAGVSPSVVMRFIKGERDIYVGTAEKLCAALDLVLVPREMIRQGDPA